mmetsp:Transcript_3690/g.7163  ORF Transcript_3690/g.7163 Transcript_3690/m.7163 type:complete len:304 (-) Transcript_3690:30-941(-)
MASLERLKEFLSDKCVFCDNRNVNSLEQSFSFKTSTVCLHRICAHCYGVVFKSKKAVDCPRCGQQIKPNRVSNKPREEIEYERQVQIRHEVIEKIYLTRADFDSDKEFNDYQELAEELVWNKIHRQKTEWTDQQIADLSKRYRANIVRRRADLDAANRLFLENQREEQLRRKEELQLMILREQEELIARQLEREEGNQVALGQRKTTRAAAERLEKQLEERKRREQEQIALEQGYAPQVVHYDQNSLWPPHQLEAQPKRDPTFVAPGSLSGTLEETALSAAAYDTEATKRRTMEVMLAGLLLM